MEPYPQKPNVTRTSKHEGSYSYEGMPREYKTNEELRAEYEARWEAGELDESMKPYLTFLRGGKPPKRREEKIDPNQNTEWHSKAKEILDRTDLPAEQLASYERYTASTEAIQHIRDGNYHKVASTYARSIYYYLKRVL